MINKDEKLGFADSLISAIGYGLIGFFGWYLVMALWCLFHYYLTPFVVLLFVLILYPKRSHKQKNYSDIIIMYNDKGQKFKVKI